MQWRESKGWKSEMQPAAGKWLMESDAFVQGHPC